MRVIQQPLRMSAICHSCIKPSRLCRWAQCEQTDWLTPWCCTSREQHGVTWTESVCQCKCYRQLKAVGAYGASAHTSYDGLAGWHSRHGPLCLSLRSAWADHVCCSWLWSKSFHTEYLLTPILHGTAARLRLLMYSVELKSWILVIFCVREYKL